MSAVRGAATSESTWQPEWTGRGSEPVRPWPVLHHLPVSPSWSVATVCLTHAGYRCRFTIEILAELERQGLRDTVPSHPQAALGIAFDLTAGTLAGALIAASRGRAHG